jgi:hypothetical protein
MLNGLRGRLTLSRVAVFFPHLAPREAGAATLRSGLFVLSGVRGWPRTGAGPLAAQVRITPPRESLLSTCSPGPNDLPPPDRGAAGSHCIGRV